MVLPPRDFESRASTNSAIPASGSGARNYIPPGHARSNPARIIRAMLLDDFDYDLPQELIAQFPAGERGGDRLLHLDGGTGALADRRVFVCAGTIVPRGGRGAHHPRVI